jgi:hypothetical protein
MVLPVSPICCLSSRAACFCLQVGAEVAHRLFDEHIERLKSKSEKRRDKDDDEDGSKKKKRSSRCEK